MNLFAHFETAICVRLTKTLVHFLWQGTFVALLVVLAAALLRRASSRARYGVYVAALLLMAASPPVTFWMVGSASAPPYPEIAKPVSWRAAPLQGALPEDERPIALLASNMTLESPESRVPGVARPKSDIAIDKAPSSFDWQRYAPYAAACYLLGVVLMLARLLAALQGGKRLRRSAVPVGDPATLAAAARCAKVLGLSLAPAVAYCRRIAVPTVVGVLRPTILLPLSLASGLSPEQVEMSLLHELAHIRRYDHLVNIAQGVIEAFLFFHPAVWLVSRRIRIERENCCDDVVVAIGGKPVVYASSLVEAAALGRSTHPRQFATATLSAGTQPSQLRRRILRLLGAPAHERVRLTRGWGIALAMACVIALPAVVCLKAQEKPTKEGSTKSPEAYTATLTSGIKIQLLGVSQNPSEGQPWWNPDGAPLDKAPYEKMRGRVHPSVGEIAREFAVRVRNLPKERAGITWRIERSRGLAAGSALKNGRAAKGLYAIATKFPAALETTTVRFGVAAGEWKTLARRTGKTGQETQGGAWGSIAFAEPYQTQWVEGTDATGFELKKETRMTVAFKLRDRDQEVRIVAINQAGKLYPSVGNFVNLDSDTTLLTVGFSGPPLDQVEFQFQVRPYEWAQFKNVALRPKEPTGEQVKTEALEKPFTNEAVPSTDSRVEMEGRWPEGRVIKGAGKKYGISGPLYVFDPADPKLQKSVERQASCAILEVFGLDFINQDNHPRLDVAFQFRDRKTIGGALFELTLLDENGGALATERVLELRNRELPVEVHGLHVIGGDDPPNRYGKAEFRFYDVSLDAAVHAYRLTVVEAGMPTLMELLAHKDAYVPASAARALGQMGPDAREAVTKLTRLLQDEHEHVREAADQALQRIGSATPSPEPSKVIEVNGFGGILEFNKEIPVELKVGKQLVGEREYWTAELFWVKFSRSDDQIQATVRVETSSVLEAKWRVRVELLDDEDKFLARAEHVFETMVAIQYDLVQTAFGQLDFSLGSPDKLDKLTKFRVAMDQAPDNANVTIDPVAAAGYVVEVDASPHEAISADLSSFEGQFEFDNDIPVELKVGERVIGNAEYFAVEAESIRFFRNGDRDQASLRVKTTTILDAKWRAGVELLTADGRVLADSEAVLATLLRILGRPGFDRGYLHFSLGRWSDVSEARKFRISIQRAPDDAEVTSYLAREAKPAKADISPDELAAEPARLNVSQARLH